MNKFELKAEKRELTGKSPEALRKEGKIPAVIYGKGKENQNIQVNELEFNNVFAKAGENNLIQLSIENEGQERNVLVYQNQLDPVRDNTIHIDFYEVRMDEAVETEVPLVFIGESPAVSDLEGTLITNKTEIRVKCLPNNIPQEIEVDISKLATFDDMVLAKDLKIPADVELLIEPEETIALVNPPRSEEEMQELDAEIVENVDAVEATEEKKDEGEGEEEKGEKASAPEEKKSE